MYNTFGISSVSVAKWSHGLFDIPLNFNVSPVLEATTQFEGLVIVEAFHFRSQVGVHLVSAVDGLLHLRLQLYGQSIAGVWDKHWKVSEWCGMREMER